MKHIGVLLPQSKAYPRIGKQFIDGLRQRFGEEEFKLSIEDVGFGADVNAVISSLDRLVLQNDVDVIVGFFGNLELDVVYDKINALEVPAVMVDFGVHQRVQSEGNKYMFSVSLDLSRSVEVFGKWASEKGLKQVGVSGSFNDIGYGLVAAAQKSIYEHGGEFSGHYTPDLNPRENEADHLKGFYENQNSDVVLNLYNGVYAKENIDYLEASKSESLPPLVFTPFGLDKKGVERIRKVTNEVFVVGSWFPESIITGKEAELVNESPFATLGWEVGSTVLEALPMREEILKEGSTKKINSSRSINGWRKDLSLDVNQFLWKVDNESSEAKVTEVSRFDNGYLDGFEGGERAVSGWHNIYLCY